MIKNLRHFIARIEPRHFLGASALVGMFWLSTFSGCASSPFGSRSEETKTVTDPVHMTIHKFQLENGLRLLVVEDSTSPTFAYQTWFRVGSRNEKVKFTGLAHFFEHMMFKGTKNVKAEEFEKLLEEAGAEGENAFTSNDYTAYIQELPKDQLELIVRLESDRMVNLLVNQESFNTEREVVINERRWRTENNPDGLIYQAIFEMAYKVHPYRWPVIGYKEDLDRMSPQDALDFYKTHYGPNQATVVIVGDVKASDAYSMIKKYYSDLKPVAEVAPITEREAPQSSPQHKRIPLNIQVEKMSMAFPIPDTLSNEIPVFDIIQAVLTGGKSGRLKRALVDRGLASNVESGADGLKDPGLFFVNVNMQKGKKASQAEFVVMKELERLAARPISTQELDRAKNRILFEFVDGLNSPYEKAKFLGRYDTVTGDYMKGFQIFQQIQKISAADVQLVSSKYLKASRRNVVTGVPK